MVGNNFKDRKSVEEISWATPLYKFLRLCNANSLEKNVLDCGAGGEEPPLSLFYRYGYKTFGLEITENALSKAQQFCRNTRMKLNIIHGDMRRIPFADEAFSFVYSFNAIFFMKKTDIAVSIKEMERVLKPGGLCYVNFMSVDDPDNELFCKTGFASRLFQSERFSKHRDDEAESYFQNFEITRKEKMQIDKTFENKKFRQVYIDYIVQKNQR